MAKPKRDPRKCTGTARSTGKPCGLYPIHGATVCHKHGAGAPQVKAAAKRRTQEQDAHLALVAYGRPRDVEPHAALLEEVRRTAGHVAMLEEIVAGLERDRLVHGVTKTVQLPEGGRRVTVEAAFSVWVALYHVERKHLLAACSTAIRCGVEQRRVELEGRQGELMAQVFRKVYDDETLGLTDKQRKTALVTTARHLRAISGGAA